MKNGSSLDSEYDFFIKNLYATKGKAIVDEFKRNARLLKTRANGNYLYHEVISITKSGNLSLNEEKQRLFDIVANYTEQRCKYNLVVGFLHDEKDNNIHYHLMISSNELDANKNMRLSKFDFDKVKKELEMYVLDKYPELNQEVLINAKSRPDKTHESNTSWELKREGKPQEKKQWMQYELKNTFAQSMSKQDLFDRLNKLGLEMYARGNTIGFINLKDGKKYRLKTLGLENEFKQSKAMLDKDVEFTQEKNKPPKSSVKTKASENDENKNDIERVKQKMRDYIKNERSKSDPQTDKDLDLDLDKDL